MYGKYLKCGRNSVNSSYSFIIISYNIVMVMMVMRKDKQDISLHWPHNFYILPRPWHPRCSWLSSFWVAKSLQSFLTLCDPIDGSPPGSPIPGILQARTLEWVAISFSNS